MDTQNLVVGAFGEDFFGAVVRLGQEDPAGGDEVEVYGGMYVACEVGDEWDKILESLRFRKRLVLCDEELCSTWGFFYHEEVESTCVDGYKTRGVVFCADTWVEAEALAAAYVRKEYGLLRFMVDARAAALLAAGE